MKKILIYGDSNLWGFDALENKRLDDKYQWANMLKDYLGSEYSVIQEGLPGRIAGNVDNERLYKNGKDTFEAIFRSWAPVDYVIIALGTNDLQNRYNRNANEIYKDLMWYKEKVDDIYRVNEYKTRFFNKNIPKFIFIIPGMFDYEIVSNLYSYESELERKKLIEIFNNNCEDKYVILNNVDLIKEDGIHYSIKGQKMVFDEVKKLFYK